MGGRRAILVRLAAGAGSVALAASCAAAPSRAERLSPSPTAPSVRVPVYLEAWIVKVVDADTFVVRLDNARQETVSLIGVDAPDRGERLSRTASERVARILTPNRLVFLEVERRVRDRRSRLLAYLWLKEPAPQDDAAIRANMLNARLLLEGLARTLPETFEVRYARQFRSYQERARKAHEGIWS